MSAQAEDVDLAGVEAFLYREADCLDAGDLNSWMHLYTEDATYWMPVTEGQRDPLGEISILYENQTLMQLRCLNFNHRLAPSFETPVRTSHLIGNIRRCDADYDADLAVRSNFHVVMFYQGRQEVFAGKATHHLVVKANDYRIRHKRVDLIDCAAPHKSMPVYL